ncbi:hypothetical protein DWE01_11680 [Salmonella enterica]|nr:hypothetical protein [Salmonella enterica]
MQALLAIPRRQHWVIASIRPRYQANVVVALIRSRNGKGAMVLEGGAFVTRQNNPSCPVSSVAKLSSTKGRIPSATGCSWRVR